eukprot:11140786-Ditylum_brightwellii.AAC.1
MLEPQARSHTRGHFFLSDKPSDLSNPPTTEIPLNGPVHSVCKVIQNVMASSSEAEIAALFANTKKGEELQMTLHEMGYQ